MHLFAGAGGGLLADLILGHTPVVAVEWDRYCCQVLRERAADGWFPELRVWEGDVRLFDPSEYTGSVDCIHAGFPCQDISLAGKQSGVGEGTRSGLYREVLRIAGVVQPRIIFLENVSAILSNGLGTVLGDLASMGYDTRWCCLRASDVGAPHHRDRWWCLSYRNGNGKSTLSINAEQICKSNITNTNSKRHARGESAKRHTIGTEQKYSMLGNGSNDMAYPCNQRLQGSKVSSNNGENREKPRNKQLARCIGSTQWYEPEPNVGRVANGVAYRVDKLKALGNGQVPLQAAAAWKLLGGE